MKKLLWVVLILVLLMLGGGIWFWQKYGTFVKMYLKMKPDESFDLAHAPPAPDYSLETHWATLPTTRDAADLIPTGFGGRDAQAGAEADVFFIHPTSYMGNTWNSAIDTGGRTRAILDWLISSEASAFNGCCRVYAPHYRQASFFAFFDQEDDGLRAIELAYEDVRSAFRYFIEHYNRDRPFLIASHSQGTLHAYRLLREEIDPGPLRHRLVAAYTIGYPFPTEHLERDFVNLHVCDGPLDTGCMIAWETWAEGSEQEFFPLPLWNGDHLERATSESKPRLCVNPLSWKADLERAEAGLHVGALAMPPWPAPQDSGESDYTYEPITELDPISPNHTGARCDDDGLYIAEQLDPPYESLFTEGNYHTHDYHLFYMNIRENAIARTNAWLEASRD